MLRRIFVRLMGIGPALFASGFARAEKGSVTKLIRHEYTEDWSFEKGLRLARERYGAPIAESRHRTIFRDGDFVVKVPTALSGIYACEEELSIRGDIYARTKPDPLGEETGLPVVRMEFVTHTGYSDKKGEEWTYFIDCGQVGHTKDGRLVAYDWEHY